MKRFLISLLVLVLMPVFALAVTTVPESVTVVEAEAFAGTDIDGLIIPASVQRVGAGVLAGSDASYLYLQGDATVLDSGAGSGVPFVFGPAGGSAAGLDGFYASETLVTDGGLYYTVTDKALPLCAVEASSLTGVVTIPKLLGGVPVTSLAELYLSNAEVDEVEVPAYLSVPSGLNASPYQTMFATAPQANVTSAALDDVITWTTEVEGDYGDTSYVWTISLDGAETTVTTSAPTMTYTASAEGSVTVTVEVTDALGDLVTSEASKTLTIADHQPVYRALLIGNTYPDDYYNELAGPDNDVRAMKTMLSSMTGTDYSISARYNLTASGMTSAIASTFAGAEAGDVSLFYYSGHGTSSGALVGDDLSLLTVYNLRSALQKVAGTKIVILDSCYSGANIGKSTDSTAAFNSAVISAFSAAARSSTNLADEGYIVLTACSKDQMSYSLSSDGIYYFGAFTYGVCYGSGYDSYLRQSLGSLSADDNGDGKITLGEAYSEAVACVSQFGNIDQSAQYYGDTSFVLWIK